MTDVGSHHFVKSGVGSDRVLVPQPSADPHDPLVRMPIVQLYRHYANIIAELEQVLEVLDHSNGDSGLVCSRIRPSCSGPNVSGPH